MPALDARCFAPHAISHHASTTPDVVALQHVDGPSLSYAQLDAEARRWAAALQALGVGPGAHVGTMLTNRFEAHFSLVALGWLRAVEVPLNTAYVGRILHYTLGLADVSVLITEAAFVERITEFVARVGS